MSSYTRIRTFLLCIGLLASVGAVSNAQNSPAPCLPDIQVKTTDPTVDLVQKTSSVTTANHPISSVPALADIEVPGYSGILVQKLDGTTVTEIGSNLAFNPASNVKIATAYAVL